MKKKTFACLVLGVIGGLLFGVGLCMCLLPEWNAFNQGVIVTAIGASVLLVLLGICLKGKKSNKKINWKTVGKVIYGTIGALVMGVGMCMILVWEMMIPGIVVGIVGIVMLLFLIPMCIGLK